MILCVLSPSRQKTQCLLFRLQSFGFFESQKLLHAWVLFDREERDKSIAYGVILRLNKKKISIWQAI